MTNERPQDHPALMAKELDDLSRRISDQLAL